jgi:hypothetical protein
MNKAAGDDWGDAQPPADLRHPTQVVVGVWLVVTASVLWLPVAGRVQSESGPQPEGLLLICCMVFAIRSLKGRHKARIATTVLVVLLFFLLGRVIQAGLSGAEQWGGRPYASLGVAASGCSFAGTALLFTPRSAAYYRAQRLQRGTRA